jgi:glycosyltransferase involved in cell wall biosynthesis
VLARAFLALLAPLQVAAAARIVPLHACFHVYPVANISVVMTAADQHSRTDEVVVAVPCFDEVLRFRTEAFSGFLDASKNVTLVFVDDGSTDDTPLVLERLRQRHPRQVCTLRLSENVGKGEAVRRGMQVALRRQPAVVGYWDADLATPLDAISRFVEVLQGRPKLDLVMGSRVALLGRDIRRSTLRHFIGRVFATAASIVLGLPVYDTQCGAKLFRVTPTFRKLISQPFRARWIFDVEILARMVFETHRTSQGPASPMIYEYPLEQWRDVHGSRLKLLDFVIAGIDLAAIYWRYRRRSVQHAQSAAHSTNDLSTLGAARRDAA